MEQKTLFIFIILLVVLLYLKNSKANFGSASTKTKIVNPNAIALEGVNKAKVNLAAAEESVQKAKDALTVAQKFQKDFIPPPPPAGITPKKTDPSKKPTTTPGPAVTDNTKKLINDSVTNAEKSIKSAEKVRDVAKKTLEEKEKFVKYPVAMLANFNMSTSKNRIYVTGPSDPLCNQGRWNLYDYDGIFFKTVSKMTKLYDDDNWSMIDTVSKTITFELGLQSSTEKIYIVDAMVDSQNDKLIPTGTFSRTDKEIKNYDITSRKVTVVMVKIPDSQYFDICKQIGTGKGTWEYRIYKQDGFDNGDIIKIEKYKNDPEKVIVLNQSKVNQKDTYTLYYVISKQVKNSVNYLRYGLYGLYRLAQKSSGKKIASFKVTSPMDAAKQISVWNNKNLSNQIIYFEINGDVCEGKNNVSSLNMLSKSPGTNIYYMFTYSYKPGQTFNNNSGKVVVEFTNIIDPLDAASNIMSWNAQNNNNIVTCFVIDLVNKKCIGRNNTTNKDLVNGKNTDAYTLF